MTYVKSTKEVENIGILTSNLTYVANGITVRFETEMDFLREVLPPCFSLPAEPVGYVNVIQEMAEVAAYKGASINVRAAYGDIEGWYHLSLFYTGDMPVTLGREMLGEPKKGAFVDFKNEDGDIRAVAMRNGIELISVNAIVGEEIREFAPESQPIFNIKGFSNGRATDLEYDPVLIVAQPTNTYDSRYLAEGGLTLKSSDVDPCGSVPIVSVDSVEYWTGRRTLQRSATKTFTLAGRSAYLPYFLGRNYDLAARFEL